MKRQSFSFNLTAGIDWYNPANREKARLIANDIEFELDELKTTATLPGPEYTYHKKNLGILKAKLTRLCNKDTNEWLQDKIAESVGRRA